MAAPVVLTPTLPRLKNVLFTTDFSPASLAAMPYAAAIVRAFGGKLHLGHIEATASLSAGLADPHLYEAVGKEAAENLAALRTSPDLQGLQPALVLAEGDFKHELQKIVSRDNIDLVVTGTRGRTGLRKMLLGSITEEICRDVTCPILTVGPGMSFDQAAAFKPIVFPTNISDLSRKAVPYIAILAREFGAQVTVLHVLAPHEGIDANHKSLPESVRAGMALTYPELAAIKAEFMVGYGDTGETVMRVAREKNAGLIAMGIRNAFRPGVLRERTAYRIIAGATCPVLTVR